MTRRTVPWSEVFNKSANRLELPPGVAELVITGAASPRTHTTIGGPTETIDADVAEQVRIEHLPVGLQSLEFMLIDDLWLDMMCDSGDLHVTCRSESLSVRVV